MTWVAAFAATLAFVGGAGATSVPGTVLDGVHGRVAGWARTGPDWFVVYVDRRGGGWCGLQGASWRLALVRAQTARVVLGRRVSGAMCGNDLAWVRAGRFSDGTHREVAFMLWTTPSIGATTYVYRIEGVSLRRLATFGGDRVELRRGAVTVSFENRGRSPRGELEDVYRFERGRYRLVGRK